MMAADFMEPGERTWQVRYAYDFAAVGVPGLTFSTRYNHGDHANPATFAGEGLVGAASAANGREAATKPVSRLCQADQGLRFYDGCAAVRG